MNEKIRRRVVGTVLAGGTTLLVTMIVMLVQHGPSWVLYLREWSIVTIWCLIGAGIGYTLAWLPPWTRSQPTPDDDGGPDGGKEIPVVELQFRPSDKEKRWRNAA